MPTWWIRVTVLKIFKVFFSVPSNSSTSPEMGKKKKKKKYERINSGLILAGAEEAFYR